MAFWQDLTRVIQSYFKTEIIKKELWETQNMPRGIIKDLNYKIAVRNIWKMCMMPWSFLLFFLKKYNGFYSFALVVASDG